eukprot:c7991_g1_i1.p1 GENE.c7991_g1_i1~~c7991_g1_i1.p1  ORF type:complete len:606 (-),score=79.98 c7991_g1_i1:1078-2895(-)
MQQSLRPSNQYPPPEFAYSQMLPRTNRAHPMQIPNHMLPNPNFNTAIYPPAPIPYTSRVVPPTMHGPNVPHLPQPAPPPIQSAPSVRVLPLVKLTIGLLGTYKHINKVYYERNPERTKTKPPTTETVKKGVPESSDDKHGDLVIHKGDILVDRFRLENLIGKGSFGQVVQAFDLKTQQYVAVKIIKGKKAFFQQAQTEIEILQHLNQKDPDDKFGVIRMKSHFIHKGHQCIVFELLSQNLYDIIRRTKYKGIKLSQVRVIGWQILRCLQFLSKPEVGVIHCDLKPENVLLCHQHTHAVKIIDFGSSCYKDKRMFSYIQSRFYRSPEVMLGLEYDDAIDCWSIGCILVELMTGEPLFGGLDAFDQMYRICLVLGIPPATMLEKSPKWSVYFNLDSQGRYTLKPATNPASQDLRKKTLPEILGLDGSNPPSWFAEKGCTHAELEQFRDLIESLLIFDPSKRMKPTAALKHIFFHQKQRVDDSNLNTGTALALQRESSSAESQPLPQPPSSSSSSASSMRMSSSVVTYPQAPPPPARQGFDPRKAQTTISALSYKPAFPAVDPLTTSRSGASTSRYPYDQLTAGVMNDPNVFLANESEHMAKRKKGSG